MEFKEIREQVERNLGGRNDDATASSILTITNWAQKLLARKGEWQELQTYVDIVTVASQASYHLVSNFNTARLRSIYSIKFWDGSRYREPLKYITFEKWDDYISTVTPTEDYPSLYTRWGLNLHFSPTPASIYSGKLYYYQLPALIEDDDDVVQLEELDQVIVAAVTGYVWASLQERSMSMYWLNLANTLLKDVRDDIRSLFGFETFAKAYSGRAHGNYWADPFVRENP